MQIKKTLLEMAERGEVNQRKTEYRSLIEEMQFRLYTASQRVAVLEEEIDGYHQRSVEGREDT